MQSPRKCARHAFKRRPRVALGQTGQFCMRWLLVLVALVALGMHSGSARAEEADLELVFSVDASGSVDNDEYRLQLQGIASALTDPEVIRAIQSGRHKRIAVDLVVWGESRRPKDHTGWAIIAGLEDAQAYAGIVASFPRRQVGGTGLGDGIAKSISSMLENDITAPRMVVDVSGDGRESPPRDYTVMLPQARAMAVYHGVTINGLAIINEDPDLAEYYSEHMVVGSGSFVEVANDYEDFARAMRKKLLREIQPEPVVGLR